MRGATSREPEKGTKHPALRPEYGRGTGVPNPIDVEVGGRIRTRRLLLGMNQQALADPLDADLELTAEGRRQAEATARRTRASWTPVALYASPLSRSRSSDSALN